MPMSASLYLLAGAQLPARQPGGGQRNAPSGRGSPDRRGRAGARGLLVRHLVLPNNLAGTRKIVRFLARQISPHTYINIMAQYHPDYRADRYPLLNRRITPEEYQAALQMAKEAGLYRLDRRQPLFVLI